MTRFAIDLEQLDNVTTRLGELVGLVSDKLDALEEHIGRLTWEGDAAREHARAHRDWDASARRLAASIDRLQAAARQAHESYSGAIAANLTILQRG